MSGSTATMEAAIHAHELASALAASAIEKKAFDLAILDMTGLVAYTDVFVLCTARNRRQVQAIAEGLRRYARDAHGLRPKGLEGLEAARWVLVDFGSVVVHIFDEPMRGFYDLDGLWADAPRLPVPEGEPAEPAEVDDDSEAAYGVS